MYEMERREAFVSLAEGNRITRTSWHDKFLVVDEDGEFILETEDGRYIGNYDWNESSYNGWLEEDK